MSTALRKCQVCRQAEWSGDQTDPTETVGGPTRDRHSPTVPWGARSRGVLSYPDMGQREGVNLQQGMNLDVRGGASVILMNRSARPRWVGSSLPRRDLRTGEIPDTPYR